MSEVSIKCGGHCCRSFTLPVSPMEFEFDFKRLDRGIKTRFKVDELKKIRNMLVYQGASATPWYLRGMKKRDTYYHKFGKEMRHPAHHHYTCKNLNRTTGLCMDYDNRPDMCRNYPDSGSCSYAKCEGKCANE